MALEFQCPSLEQAGLNRLLCVATVFHYDFHSSVGNVYYPIYEQVNIIKDGTWDE